MNDITEITKELVLPMLPKRLPNSHKGTYGTAALVCGSYKMAGAAVLAARSAYRTGVGKVVSVLPKSIYPIVATAVPEAVFEPYRRFDMKYLKNSSACLIGCGCGNCKRTEKTVKKILKNYKNTVIIDADGINSIAKNIRIIKQYSANAVLTPHPKEAANILGVSVAEVQENREKSVKKIAKLSGAVTLLKGADTLIATPDERVYILKNDNSGLATAGSGDVLSGIITALSAMGLTAENSAVSGAFLHAEAGRLCAEIMSETSMCASDIIDFLPKLFCEIYQNR